MSICSYKARDRFMGVLNIHRESTPAEFNKEWRRSSVNSKGLTVPNSSGQHPMIIAAMKGNVALIQYFNKKDKSVLNLGDDCGWTPLHYAVCYRQFQAASTLLDIGADVNSPSTDLCECPLGLVPQGASALWIACVLLTHDLALRTLLLRFGGIAIPILFNRAESTLKQAREALAKERAPIISEINSVIDVFPAPLLQIIIEYI